MAIKIKKRSIFTVNTIHMISEYDRDYENHMVGNMKIISK